MFICEKCEKEYKVDQFTSLFGSRSYGRCEGCGETASCVDHEWKTPAVREQEADVSQQEAEEMFDHSVFCGISHPFWNVTPDWFYRGWRRIMCQRGYHLFDEVLSDTTEHTLVCDACQLEVGIAYINQPGQAG